MGSYQGSYVGNSQTILTKDSRKKLLISDLNHVDDES